MGKHTQQNFKKRSTSLKRHRPGYTYYFVRQFKTFSPKSKQAKHQKKNTPLHGQKKCRAE
jgi:hypothetical protein